LFVLDSAGFRVGEGKAYACNLVQLELQRAREAKAHEIQMRPTPETMLSRLRLVQKASGLDVWRRGAWRVGGVRVGGLWIVCGGGKELPGLELK